VQTDERIDVSGAGLSLKLANSISRGICAEFPVTHGVRLIEEVGAELACPLNARRLRGERNSGSNPNANHEQRRAKKIFRQVHVRPIQSAEHHITEMHLPEFQDGRVGRRRQNESKLARIGSTYHAENQAFFGVTRGRSDFVQTCSPESFAVESAQCVVRRYFY
jgi:hypothetical protein